MLHFPRIRPQNMLLWLTSHCCQWQLLRPKMVTTTFGPSRKGLDVRWQQRWLLCHFHIGLLVKSVPNLWAYSFWIWLLSITLGRKWQTKEKHVIQSGSRFPLCKKLWTWGRGSIKKNKESYWHISMMCPEMQKLDKTPTMKIICPHKKANQYLSILMGNCQLTN